VALIIIEPDFGTAVFVGTLSVAMLFVAGIRIRTVLPFALGGGGIAAYFMATHFRHVQDRLMVFLHPEMDPLGKGYQIRQSLLALGSGGVLGQGLGESRQKLFFLPLEHSDFIFAIIGEELGLVGSLLILGLFVGFVFAGIRIMRAAADDLGFLLAFGVVFFIGLQASLNIAVVTAALPTKGIPLPFVSFGGSSLVISMIGVGILLNVASQGRWGGP
jgi:cell division protein FtsW